MAVRAVLNGRGGAIGAGDGRAGAGLADHTRRAVLAPWTAAEAAFRDARSTFAAVGVGGALERLGRRVRDRVSATARGEEHDERHHDEADRLGQRGENRRREVFHSLSRK